MRLGIWEILIIAAVVLLLFKAKKLPEIARSIGEAIKEFKKAGKDSASDGKKDNS